MNMNKINIVLNEYNDRIDRVKKMKAKYELVKSKIIAKLDEYFDNNDYEAFASNSLDIMLGRRFHRFERLLELEKQFNEREYPILEDHFVFEDFDKPSCRDKENALYDEKDILEVAKENLGLIKHNNVGDPSEEIERVRNADSKYREMLKVAFNILENNPDEKLANIMDRDMIYSLVVYCNYSKKALAMYNNIKYGFVVDEKKLKDYLSQYKMTYTGKDQIVSIASKDLDELIALARKENQEEQTNNDEVTLSL